MRRKPFNKSSKPAGMTLVEVIVTGLLFGIVMTMIAQAMVTGHRTQSQLSHKINIQRQASNALDLLIRDAEAGRYVSSLGLYNANVYFPVPNVVTAVSPPRDLRITRMSPGATIYDSPTPVSVAYTLNTTDSTLRRILYNPSVAPPTPLAGTPADGKVLVQDVREFDARVYNDATTGLDVLSVRLKVASMSEPITKEFSLE